MSTQRPQECQREIITPLACTTCGATKTWQNAWQQIRGHMLCFKCWTKLETTPEWRNQ